jgi:glutamine amidotransferase
MCIAIYKPAHKIISKETLQECYLSNPDGAGFSYSSGDRIKIRKGFFSFDSFWNAYKYHQHKQCLIHFRIMTHGKVMMQNCHPFFINNKMSFIHNGIISHHSKDKNISDTKQFNDKILKPLVDKYGTSLVFHPSFATIIEQYIGYSKLVFLDVDGNYKIFNEDKGVWDDGIWYSNNSYKQVDYSYSRTKSYLPDTSYYVPKSYGIRIDVGDFVRVNESIKGMLKNSLVEVISINANGYCDVETMEGTLIPAVDSGYLDYINYETCELDSNGLVVEENLYASRTL